MATRAGPRVGVMGEYGGWTGGDADLEFEGELWPCCDLGEVSTVKPGMVLLGFGRMRSRG